MKIGSAAHRDAFCRQFSESYTAYEPDRLPWPALAGVALSALRFWSLRRPEERPA